MKKILTSLWLSLILFCGGVVYAQNCDPLLPCGPLPWQLPSLPDLQSPSPFPTVAVVATGSTSTPTQTASSTPTALPTSTPMPTFTPFPTLTPYPTFTLLPTWTPFVDVAQIGNAVGTLNALVASTDIPVYDLTGTPVTMANLDDIASNTGTAFGYVRGLANVNFGPLTPLVVFAFTALFIFILVNIAGIVMPIAIAVFGVIRKIIELILDFIPG